MASYYAKCAVKAWRDSLNSLGFSQKSSAMRAALIWAATVLALWLIPWPESLPGDVDIGGELKLGLSAVIAILLGFALVFCVNLIVTPARLDAEAQAEITTLHEFLTPKILVQESNNGKPQKIYFGSIFTSGNGTKHPQPRWGGEFVAVDCCNPTSELIRACEAHIISVSLKDDAEISRFMQEYDYFNGNGIIDPITLSWAIDNESPKYGNIPSMGTRRLLVLKSLSEHLYFLEDNVPLNYIDMLKKGYDYRILISINSENTPGMVVELMVCWRDEVTFSIERIQQHARNRWRQDISIGTPPKSLPG